MPAFAWIGLTVGIVLIIVLIAYETHNSGGDTVYGLGGVLLGLGIASLMFWYGSAAYNAGLPIACFDDGDVFKISVLSPIVDDSKTMAVGMRRVADGNPEGFSHSETMDLSLRFYRFDKQLLEPVLNQKLPIYVKASKIGDTVTFQVLSKREIDKIRTN